MEESIYAIIALPKNKVDLLNDNFEYELFVTNGINGTCFFVSPNQFITAHHVLNSIFYKKNIYFLINTNGNILTDISIESENPDTDLCVGHINHPVNQFCKIPSQNLSISTTQKFLAYGYSARETYNFKLKIKKENGIIKILSHDKLNLEKVEYKFRFQHTLQNHSTTDLMTNLKN